MAPSDYHLFPGLKKKIESSPFFVRRGGHCCRGDLVGRTTFWFFFEWLAKVRATGKEVYWASWGVCWINPEFGRCRFFLPARAKDLPAPPRIRPYWTLGMTTHPFELVTYNPRKIMEYLHFCRYSSFIPEESSLSEERCFEKHLQRK